MWVLLVLPVRINPNTDKEKQVILNQIKLYQGCIETK